MGKLVTVTLDVQHTGSEITYAIKLALLTHVSMILAIAVIRVLAVVTVHLDAQPTGSVITSAISHVLLTPVSKILAIVMLPVEMVEEAAVTVHQDAQTTGLEITGVIKLALLTPASTILAIVMPTSFRLVSKTRASARLRATPWPRPERCVP